MKKCTNCNTELPDKDRYCKVCGESFYVAKSKDSGIGAVIDGINDYVGNDDEADLNWKSLFADVFKKHSFDQAEELFIYGTKKTTPSMYEVSHRWPKPWLYSRVFMAFTLAFIFLNICVAFFGNSTSIPGLITVGAFAVPLSIMILFYEINAYRNISIFAVLFTFLVGGCASLLATLLLHFFIGATDIVILTTFLAAAFEEIAKVAIVYIILRRLSSCKSILNGLLIGAAVGAGFAAFESAGYAFNCLISEDVDSMYFVTYLRAFLAPGGHVTWAAISGAALMIASKGQPLTIKVFSSNKFWRLFIIPIVLHTMWNMPLPYMFIKLISLTIIVWIVTLILVEMGLKQVRCGRIY